MNNIHGKRESRSFVLRKGRTTLAQKKAIERYMPIYGIYTSKKKLDYKYEFCRDNPVILEIGFGTGEATIEIAAENPRTNYIAIDVYPSGVGNLLQKINERKLQNIRLIQDDAKTVINEMICDNSLLGIHIFFPDPWPKKKHHKRRLLTFDFLNQLEKKLKQKGYLHIVTDWEEYWAHIDANVKLIKSFTCNAIQQKIITKARPATKFEKRGLSQGHSVKEIVVFKKNTIKVLSNEIVNQTV